MANLLEYKPKEWREKRDALEKMLHEADYGSFTRIIRAGMDSVTLEGSGLQVTYDTDVKEMYVHGRGGSRYAGGYHSVDKLVKVWSVFLQWQAKHVDS